MICVVYQVTWPSRLAASISDWSAARQRLGEQAAAELGTANTVTGVEELQRLVQQRLELLRAQQDRREEIGELWRQLSKTRATVRSLADESFSVIVVEDGCAAASDDLHRHELEIINMIYCHVMSSSELLGYLP